MRKKTCYLETWHFGLKLDNENDATEIERTWQLISVFLCTLSWIIDWWQVKSNIAFKYFTLNPRYDQRWRRV